MYNIAIIGGGPGGYTAAERAAHAGLTVVIFEKSEWGGVCLNEGCIPTKTLLYSAKLLENAKSSSKYGLNIEGISVDYSKIVARKNKVIRKLNAGIRAKMKHDNITTINGVAEITNYTENQIEIYCNGEIYSAQNLIISTGSHNFTPPIKGLLPENIWTSTEALQTKELPSSIAIIGGGVIGMEFAGLFNSMGVQVTVIEMMDEILGNMDKEISATLRQEYTNKGITFYLQSKVLELNGNELIFEKDGTHHSISTEKILLSVGRKPNIDGFGMDKLGIELFKGGIQVNEFMQTSQPNVYAIGDVTGFSMLAHTAVREAEVAVNHLSKVSDKMSYSAIPGVVYTYPEVAGVGETEESLSAKNIPYKIMKLPLTFSGRFVAENEAGNGLCKIISSIGDNILGVHLIGNPSSELITIATLAIEQQLTVVQWQKSVFPHPTVGEIIKETLFS